MKPFGYKDIYGLVEPQEPEESVDKLKAFDRDAKSLEARGLYLVGRIQKSVLIEPDNSDLEKLIDLIEWTPEIKEKLNIFIVRRRLIEELNPRKTGQRFLKKFLTKDGYIYFTISRGWADRALKSLLSENLPEQIG